jgi:hypothetical protein
MFATYYANTANSLTVSASISINHKCGLLFLISSVDLYNLGKTPVFKK